jgi:hypothetical protein
MPALIPVVSDARMTRNGGIVGSTSPAVAVPEGGSLDTYGAVTELLSAASNVYGGYGISVDVMGRVTPSATLDQGAVDILIGGATDDVLIKSLLVGGGYAMGRSYFFPVLIPPGVRIAAQQARGRTLATDTQVLITLWGTYDEVAPWPTGRKVTAIGTKASDSRGQAVVPTASGGAASVTQLSASTAEDYFYVLPSFQCSTDTTIASEGYVNIGIGVGAATEERIGTWLFWKNTEERQAGPLPPMGCFRKIPAGSRLTLLASNSGANDGAYDGLIHAVS